VLDLSRNALRGQLPPALLRAAPALQHLDVSACGLSGPLPAEWPVHSFYGPAGTTFLTDTRGLHNGFPPSSGARLLLWARWSTKAPDAYFNDETVPTPWRQVVSAKPDETTQARTRLVVDWT
jgi:hypothetical protein